MLRRIDMFYTTCIFSCRGIFFQSFLFITIIFSFTSYLCFARKEPSFGILYRRETLGVSHPPLGVLSIEKFATVGKSLFEPTNSYNNVYWNL